ncbi:MAG: exosortase/archaeosortase family protein [Chthonomonadaceae bacterium]|nr:exosortase/archaeosortase family protein [Chthonomonadaceae bacterium]
MIDTEDKKEAAAETPEPIKGGGFDLGAIVRSPAFLPGLLLAVGIALVFGSLWPQLLPLWTGDDGYYSHGFLVPLISVYVVYRWWPRLQKIPVRPFLPAGVLLLALLWFARVTHVTQIYSLMSITLMFTLIASVWLLAGGRWAANLSLPILYLGFAMPLWSTFIQTYTNPLQVVSTKAAFKMLGAFQLDPYLGDATTIYLPHFTLDVGVPCSGLKLVLALSAFTILFMLIANLKWWGNVAMVAILLPLTVFVNGLRIALIGVVGNAYGPQAGHDFHDYSGYITLLVCFFLLFKFARLLGWKD